MYFQVWTSRCLSLVAIYTSFELYIQLYATLRKNKGTALPIPLEYKTSYVNVEEDCIIKDLARFSNSVILGDNVVSFDIAWSHKNLWAVSRDRAVAMAIMAPRNMQDSTATVDTWDLPTLGGGCSVPKIFAIYSSKFHCNCCRLPRVAYHLKLVHPTFGTQLQ